LDTGNEIFKLIEFSPIFFEKRFIVVEFVR